MTRREIVAKINELLAEIDACVEQKLEKRHARVIEVLCKFTGQPEFVKEALAWGYTRTMIGSLASTEEAKARESAYVRARWLILAGRNATEATAIYDYSNYRKQVFKYAGECAGYLFAAKERVKP